jgi:hypothetical protein
MNKRDKTAFTIYLTICLLGLAFGIAYLACKTVMPYHHQAIGIDWEELRPGLQVMLANFVNFAGAGFITGSLSMLWVASYPLIHATTCRNCVYHGKQCPVPLEGGCSHLTSERGNNGDM